MRESWDRDRAQPLSFEPSFLFPQLLDIFDEQLFPNYLPYTQDDTLDLLRVSFEVVKGF